MKLYVSLGEHYEGYSRKHVTPYMHIMVFQVPDMIERHGNIKMFSGQGKSMKLTMYTCIRVLILKRTMTRQRSTYSVVICMT